MLPIMIATVMESMIKQLPQIDLTFGIGDIVGSVALLVSAFTFYISYTQSSQSEQIKTSRNIWAVINVEWDKIKSIKRNKPHDVVPEDSVRPLFTEIDYFAYLITKKEINDYVVLGYYLRQLTLLIGYLYNMRCDNELKISWYEFPNLFELAKRIGIDSPERPL
jgi:hypothetical protein